MVTTLSFSLSLPPTPSDSISLSLTFLAAVSTVGNDGGKDDLGGWIKRMAGKTSGENEWGVDRAHSGVDVAG